MFTVGIGCFVAGWRAARRPGLRRYTWLPALVSLAVVGAGLALTFSWVPVWSAWLTGLLPDWLDLLGRIITPVLYLVTALAGTWLFGLLAVIVASPFLGDLSLAVESRELLVEPPRPAPFWASLPGSLLRELRKLGYYLPRLLVVFVVTLIPLVNVLAPLLWFGFGAWILAVQFCDYPNENRGRPFRATIQALQGSRLAALGFGACATLALAVPLINFLLIPTAVAGGTLLWGRLEGVAGEHGQQSSG